MLADVLQQRLSILQAVMAVTVLGVFGIFILLLLGFARRRYLHHQRPSKPATPVPDIWRESGRRLTAQLDQDPDSTPTQSTPQEPPLRRPGFLNDLDNLPPDPPDTPESPEPPDEDEPPTPKKN